jgi:hypothetical protein
MGASANTTEQVIAVSHHQNTDTRKLSIPTLWHEALFGGMGTGLLDNHANHSSPTHHSSQCFNISLDIVQDCTQGLQWLSGLRGCKLSFFNSRRGVGIGASRQKLRETDGRSLTLICK